MGLLSGAVIASFACCDGPPSSLTVWSVLARRDLLARLANLNTIASYKGLVKGKS